ncbi:MAG TPA: metalloregulator ArsR/SmtB family transcription factor [Vicinamibacterales bacterium]|jgi:DNA-binding transcriptional ArsR family regulator
MNELTDATVERLTQIFRVLGDPTRVRLLNALTAREHSVGNLAVALGVSQSAVSHQLRLLRGARIVRPRRAGRSVYYALDDKHVAALFREGLRHALEDAGKAGR